MTPQTAAQIIRNHGWRGAIVVTTECSMDSQGNMASECVITGCDLKRDDNLICVSGADVGFATIRAILEVDGYNRKVEVEAQKANDELLNLMSERVGTHLTTSP